jgi:predicted pyridoxine 5'-phosphate oxidase superfamily flavin-nucleotide-binding protein
VSRAFADIGFTDSVKAAQSRYGSRDQNRGIELAEDPHDELTSIDMAFIASRDSFYLATVSESGWPYVQHRGGPKGFLRVLDTRTIGYADFAGNRQYLSVGNIDADDRVSLFLMDYARQRRMKLWGRARIVHKDDAPEVIAQLEVPGYRARVERGIIISIESIDWNCPQHIVPRFTEAEISEATAPLREENRRLKEQLQQLQMTKDSAT